MTRLGFAALATVLVAATIRAEPGLAQSGQPLRTACAEAAQRYFGDFEARTDMRRSEDRVDGTRTVGGEIYLETRSAYVACGFPPRGDGRKLAEFFVDGEDRLAELRRKPSAAGGN